MVKEIVDGLENGAGLSKDALAALLLCGDMEEIAYLKAHARQAADRVFGKDIYIRGLIEFTPITAKMTVITAASGAAMRKRSVTG